MMVGKTLLIRTDANAEIGTGHVMRCLALAQAWQGNGGGVLFALAAGSEQVEQRIRSEEAQVTRISAEPSSYEDASQTKELSTRSNAEWLVVDGYHFSADYLRLMRQLNSRLLLMDDGGMQRECECDVVLNIDPHASDLTYPEQGRTQFLLGPSYALLRREFVEFPHETREIPATAGRVIITLGGGDVHNVTLQVIDALQDIDDMDLDITVVAGHSNPHRQSLEAGVENSRHRIRIQSNVKTMAELMSQSDLAITAGGGTCYELAYMGVPMFLITTAVNQEGAVKALARFNTAYSAGWFSSLDRSTLSESLRRILQSQTLRKDLVENARSMVDGKGAARVVETMLSISRQKAGAPA